MNNSDWRRLQSHNWPEDSLQKTLLRDFPGCKTLQEALEKQKVKVPKQESKRYHPDYYPMKALIKEIEMFIELNKSDYDALSQETRDRLSAMPIKNIDEARFWKEAIFFEMKKELKHGEDHNNGSVI